MELNELARRILADFDARKQGTPLGEPIECSTDQAYALQTEIARLRERRGEHIIGYKVGCTSRTIQIQLGVEEPIFGRLFDTESHPSGGRLRCGDYVNLAIEGELAIRLSHDLPLRPVSDEDYAGAIGSVFAVIELHHYVLPTVGHPAAALIASGGMHAGFVLPLPETGCRSGFFAEVERLEVTINDRLAGTTLEPWTMGGPEVTLRWLSARLAGWGLQLRRGQVILTGSALPLFPVNSGSRIVVEARTLGTSSIEID